MSQWTDRCKCMCLKTFQSGNILSVLLVLINSKFCEFTLKRITMATSLINIQQREKERERRKRERERKNSSNQIHGDSSGHACLSGCTTLYRRLSSPLSTRASATSQHPRTILSLSLFRSPLGAARPLTTLLHLIGPWVLTYTRCLGHV